MQPSGGPAVGSILLERVVEKQRSRSFVLNGGEKVTGIAANSLRSLRCSPHPRVNPHSIPTILSSFLAVAAASFSLT